MDSDTTINQTSINQGHGDILRIQLTNSFKPTPLARWISRGIALDRNHQGLSPTSLAGPTLLSEELSASLPSSSIIDLRIALSRLVSQNVQARETAPQMQRILQTKTSRAQPLHSTRSVQAPGSDRQPTEVIPLPNDYSSPTSVNSFSALSGNYPGSSTSSSPAFRVLHRNEASLLPHMQFPSVASGVQTRCFALAQVGAPCAWGIPAIDEVFRCVEAIGGRLDVNVAATGQRCAQHGDSMARSSLSNQLFHWPLLASLLE